MNLPTMHPSLWELGRFQTRAKVRKFIRRIKTPRRIVLTIVAGVLLVLWLFQLVAGVLFREQADPARLRMWIPLGLTSYALWHLLKTFTAKPIEPFEWTDTEREVLLAAPLSRRDLVLFRLKSVVCAAAFKAGVFAFAMLPDLKVWPLGFLGMLMGLTLLDLIRMAAEVVAAALPTPIRNRVRAAVLAVAGGGFLSAVIMTFIGWSQGPQMQPAVVGLGLRFLSSCIELGSTLPGQIAQLPFRPFAAVILASASAGALLFQVVFCAAFVALAAWGLLRLDEVCLGITRERERAKFSTLLNLQDSAPSYQRTGEIPHVRVPKFGSGVGLLMWRQLLGIRHYPASVLVSMVVPAVLSLFPMFTEGTQAWIMLQVVGSLVFYSFLLMPSALRFDYRRDVDRMAVLRALPISPLAATIGQLAAPVIACTVFQWFTMLVAMLIQPYPISWLLVSTILFLPVNVLIFGLENIIFLLFPYRHKQEGVNVFLRSILTFTAKGILFLAGAVVTIGWGWLAKGIVARMGGDPLSQMQWVFSLGMWTIMAITGAVMVCTIARIYSRFDPSQDTPPMS